MYQLSTPERFIAMGALAPVGAPHTVAYVLVFASGPFRGDRLGVALPRGHHTSLQERVRFSCHQEKEASAPRDRTYLCAVPIWTGQRLYLTPLDCFRLSWRLFVSQGLIGRASHQHLRPLHLRGAGRCPVGQGSECELPGSGNPCMESVYPLLTFGGLASSHFTLCGL